MKYLHTIFLILVAFSFSFNRQPDPCKSIKTGSFTYKEEMFGQCLIERNDPIQSEKVLSNGMVVQTRVTWLSDCEYQMIFLNANFSMPDSIIRILRTTPVTTKIIKVEKDYYIASTKKFNGGKPGIDTLWKVIK